MAIHAPQLRLRAPWRGSTSATKRLCAAVMVVALCAATVSCHAPADEPATATYAARIDVDWSGYGEDAPAGMTVVFHHSATGAMVRAIDNNTDHTTAALPTGRYWATVFNLTPDEFDDIGFRGFETAETAEAYAREYTGRRWDTIPCNDNSYVACQPQRLATDTILTAAVEPTSETRVIGTLHPCNIIHTLHISVTTGTPGALIAARGAISGLASGRRLASDRPNTDTVIHLIDSDSWSRSADASVQTTVRCFGLPPTRQGLPEENIFEFQALLSDGKTVKTYTMPVGHLIKAAAGNDLDIHLELKLDPVLPSAGDGGNIDVWLQDWDGSIDLNLPL